MSAINKLVRYPRNRFSNWFNARCSSSQIDSIKSSIPDVEIPHISLIEFVTKDFGRWHNKIAMECAITGRKYTFDELRINATKLAKFFQQQLKLQNKDVVALILPNVPEFPICIFGSLMAGLTITTVNPAYTPDEIRRQLLDADVKAIITVCGNVEKVKTAASITKQTIPIIGIKIEPGETVPSNTIIFQEILNQTTEDFSINFQNSDNVIVMPYSSGTTGLPKGVELTNINLVANISQFHSPAFQYLEETSENHQDVLPAILPMFHIYGFTIQTLALLQKGCKIVTLPQFSPELYLRTIINQKANILMVAPPVVMFLNSNSAIKYKHLQHLRAIMCGAAPLGASDEEKFRQKVGKPIHVYQGYGLTETSPAVLMVPARKQGECFGSVGHPFPNTMVKVVAINDPDLTHLGQNQIGELLVKGPQVMRGYYKKPKETQESFVDGWLRTGDLARYDKSEMFYVADRIKELIKVKGFQVTPAELEETIRRFPNVAEAAVIGIPHKFFGEVPRAYVVPKEGNFVDVNKLNTFMKSSLTSYKQLVGGVVIVDSIPKNPSGKILRRQLKLKFEEKGV